ncbi:signal peptidase I [Paenibacillus sp. SYP-B4298]|uniref:signal peptidase I n=1 Tax=Paenibacillus sp. SYP-B4298 TaxID=2996034 RepID=UPI0022DD24D6|nr:signal peptidase I [Paenibacillus sp. SYP-B4298]
MQKNWKKEVREWALTIAGAVAISLLIQNYAFAQTEVHNISMEGTLVEGQRLIEDKVSYRIGEPERGDIVIINGSESDKRLIKRLIGLPGDTIDMHDGKLILNGEEQDEPYVKGETRPLGMELPYVVPEGKVFVLGDNRERSMDSRDLGPIAMSSLEGKAIFRLWPLSEFGNLR